MPKPALKPIRMAAAPLKIQARDDAGPKKVPTFTMLAYTGAPMSLEGYYEQVIVDLAGVRPPKGPIPILRQHKPEWVVGHTTAVTISPTEITAAGVISAVNEHARDIVDAAGNDFPWQASIGADPVRNERIEPGAAATVNGREVTGPVVICRESELTEISVVTRGADSDTSTTVSAARARAAQRRRVRAMPMTFDQYMTGKGFSAEEITDMSDDTKAAFKKCMKADAKDDDKPADAEDDDAVKPADAADDEDKPVDAEGEPEPDEDDKPKDAKAKAARRFAADRKAEAAELRRVSGIKARCQKYAGVDRVKLGDGRTVDLIPHAIEAGWSPERAENVALKASRPGPDVGGPLVYATNKPEVDEAVIEAALLQAGRCELFDDDFYKNKGLSGPHVRQLRAEMTARYPDRVQQAAHTVYRGGIGLQQMLTRVAAMSGYRGSEVIRTDGDLAAVAHACMRPIRADGASTAAISNVLANVQNKFLGQGYFYTEQAWRKVCAVKSVKDFKPTSTVNLFTSSTYDDVGANGELKYADLQDQAFSNKATTTGKMISLNRQQIINDDLGALTDTPKHLGRMAGTKLNKTFWTAFMNPGKDEGGSTDFWAATHTITGQSANANYIEGAATNLGSAGLTTAVYTFNKQVDPGNFPLGVDPKILLYPVELDNAAWELMNSQFLIMSALGSTSAASKQPSANQFQGRFEPVMSRYLSNSAFTGYSTSAWYLLADPGELPVIECCFLGGAELPTVQTAGPDFQFNILGITMRAFYDFGVNKQNFRGGLKSKGAA